MSGPPSSPAKGEKTMSSRLLTMKFMQRAAATAATKEPQSPAASDGKRTPKRPRLSTEPTSPSTPQSDLVAISAALAAEEEKRREAIARQAAEAGESEWVLDVPAASYTPQPIVLSADSLDAEGNTPQGGRRAYGNFMRKKPVVSVVETKPQEEDDEEERQLKRTIAQHRADPAAVTDHIARLQEMGRQKQARQKLAQDRAEAKALSKMNSISGGGSRGGSSPMMGAPSLKKKKRKH